MEKMQCIVPAGQPGVTLMFKTHADNPVNNSSSLPILCDLNDVEPPLNGLLYNNNLHDRDKYASKYIIDRQLTTESQKSSFISFSFRVNDDEHLKKKFCPLELSIKAAELDLEFEQQSDNTHCNDGSTKRTMVSPLEANDMCSTFSGIGQSFSEVHPTRIGSSNQPVLVMPVQEEPLKVFLVELAPEKESSVIVPSEPLTLAITASHPASAMDVARAPYSPVLPSIPNEIRPLPEVPDQQKSPPTPSNFPPVSTFSKTEITREEFLSPPNGEHSQESLICEVDESGDECSPGNELEDNGNHRNDSRKKVVESLVLKIRKVPSNPRCRKTDWKAELAVDKEKCRRLHNKPDSEDEWSDSDDEALIKRNKENVDDPECFIQAVKCCAKKCSVRINAKSQKEAFDSFTELEEKQRGDCYLGTCIELVSRLKPILPVLGQPLDGPTSAEIATESNGNQSVLNEIENAIKESLRDQVEGENKTEDQNLVKVVKRSNCVQPIVGNFHTWRYYILLNGKRIPCCKNMLLQLLRISSSRIETLESKIVNGEPLDCIPTKPRFRRAISKVWDLARRHLDILTTIEVPFCKTNPTHRQFLEPITRLQLFDLFSQWHERETGEKVPIKYESYRKFLHSSTNIVFPTRNDPQCSMCDQTDGQPVNKGSSGVRAKPSKKEDKEMLPNKRKRKSIEDVSSAQSKSIKVKSPKSDGDSNKSNPQKSKLKGNSTDENKAKVVKPADGKVKRKRGPRKQQRGDVFSLMISHLRTMPYRIPRSCVDSKGHKFFSPALYTVKILYEEYRKYFLKETNSELGLRYAIYESLFLRNPHYKIEDFDPNEPECPMCKVSTTLPKDVKKKCNGLVKS